MMLTPRHAGRAHSPAACPYRLCAVWVLVREAVEKVWLWGAQAWDPFKQGCSHGCWQIGLPLSSSEGAP